MHECLAAVIYSYVFILSSYKINTTIPINKMCASFINLKVGYAGVKLNEFSAFKAIRTLEHSMHHVVALLILLIEYLCAFNFCALFYVVTNILKNTMEVAKCQRRSQDFPKEGSKFSKQNIPFSKAMLSYF